MPSIGLRGGVPGRTYMAIAMVYKHGDGQNTANYKRTASMVRPSWEVVVKG